MEDLNSKRWPNVPACHTACMVGWGSSQAAWGRNQALHGSSVLPPGTDPVPLVPAYFGLCYRVKMPLENASYLQFSFNTQHSDQ